MDEDLFAEFDYPSENEEIQESNNPSNLNFLIGKKTTRNSNQKESNDLINIATDNENNSSEIEDELLKKNVTKLIYQSSSFSSNDSSLSFENNDNIKIIKEEFKGGIHETIIPKNYTPSSESSNNNSMKKPPATTYPFVLDEFQNKSIDCLENNQSVLVSAHTSAGKTVVAEYAIAMALRDNQKVIYTSPIKALSNQKYRELSQKFKDVGLMTGDVTLNQNATCIVMTTEILRNMLYRGSELTKEVAWVIFDEVHYMRDKIRGVVWEETIILLSNKINFVFLSATIPNAREFAIWISTIKNQICNVVYTDFRPVPLQHYVYPSSSDSIFLAVDEHGNFKENNFDKALSCLNDNNNYMKLYNTYLNNKDENNNKHKSKFEQMENDIKQIVELVKDSNLDPAIVFVFSKKDCKQLSSSLAKIDINLTTIEERTLIEEIYSKAMKTLSDNDQTIEPITTMLAILKKGIAMHHSGMLPIVRECVELIFQEGLIKVLFSTETFSMGVNMPAKTVVFTNLEKFDGKNHRIITGGEFIQMSGRAGRRGLDSKGITIIMLNKKIEVEKIQNILKGENDYLNSSFMLSYNQILNLGRIDGVKCEYIIKNSFRQFQAERYVPILIKKITKLFDEYEDKYIKNSNFINEKILKGIINNKEKIKMLKEKIRSITTLKNNINRFLTPGRLIKIRNFGNGIVFNLHYNLNNILNNNFDDEKKLSYVYKYDENLEQYKYIKIDDIDNSNQLNIVFVLVYIKNENNNYINYIISGKVNKKNGSLKIVPFIVDDCIEGLSNIKINLPKLTNNNMNNVINKDIIKLEGFKNIEKIVMDVFNKFSNNNIPLMDPLNDMKINDKNLQNYFKNLKIITEENNKSLNIILNKNNKESNTNSKENEDNEKILDDKINFFKEKIKTRTEIKNLLSELDDLKKLILQEELLNMKRVLKRLQYIDNNEVVTLKGQTACNISTSDELLLTEMLFNGVFNNIEEDYLNSMLSCCLTNEGSSFINESKKVNENNTLMNYHKLILENAEFIGDILIENKININKENYMKNFKNDYMIVIYLWSVGEKTFGDICKESEIYEGNIIRMIRRLDELLKELIECARLIGNINLKNKFENCSKKIKRGLPFTASLYLSN